MSINWENRIAEAKRKLREHAATETLREAAPPGSAAFAKTFDHTLLKPEATSAQIQALCEEAKTHDFATVCIRESFVKQASDALKGTTVKVCCVVGFHDPTATTLDEKLAEAKSALAAGATELDMVINWQALKANNYDEAFKDLNAMREAVSKSKAGLKVIFETSQLSQDDVVAACVLASEADFEFVKTSTGFLGSGAKVEDVKLMHQMCVQEGKGMLVKASGGIRTVKDAVNMLQAGASRLGASASVAIMQASIAK